METAISASFLYVVPNLPVAAAAAPTIRSLLMSFHSPVAQLTIQKKRTRVNSTMALVKTFLVKFAAALLNKTKKVSDFDF